MVEVAQPSIGQYTLTREIQRNPQSILYEAVDAAQNPVLVQVIAPEISGKENFIVRFELLKRLLPAIQHPNLVTVTALEQQGNLFALIKRRPTKQPDSPLVTLEEINLSDTPNRHRAYESLFSGLTEALLYLQQVRDSFHKEGIYPDCVCPSRIYVDFEENMAGGAPKLAPRLDGYCETFLFYGDTESAELHERLDNACAGSSLFAQEHFFAPDSRAMRPTAESQVLYALGALIYQSLAGIETRGIFPKLAECDPTLDPLWDEMADICLNTTREGRSVQSLAEKLRTLKQQRAQLSPQERKLQNLNIPEGMALVVFDDKVELGAMDGPDVEQPRFRAKLRPFLIDLAPVTNIEFERFLKNHIRSTYSAEDHCPATLISWNLAQAYCKWRSIEEGLPEDTYRLPTEYEWEAAVRGTGGDQYPWGANVIPHRMHCGRAKEEGAFAVRQLPPGRYGLYDMLGNVWEWTASLFKAHPFSKHHQKEYDSKLYVVKGGCWFTPVEECRASARAAFPANEQRGNVGFRCVRLVDLEQ